MKYKYSGHVPIKVRAEVVGNEIGKLINRNKGMLTAQELVTAATPPTSKLHDCFEWDNKEAAKQYRLEQARRLIRAVIVYEGPTEDKEEIHYRAFPNIEADEGNYYTTMARVTRTPKLRKQLGDQILRDLEYLMEKHEAHSPEKFKKVWKAIRALQE